MIDQAKAITILEELRQQFTIQIDLDRERVSCELWSDQETPSYFRCLASSEANTFKDAILLLEKERLK